MKKNLITALLFILTLITSTGSQNFKPVDFEAAGYVTEVYFRQGLNTHALFARTDIGGVYMSEYNYQNWKWGNWNLLNTFALTPASMHVQGFEAQQGLVYFMCCGTDYLEADPGRGLWRVGIPGNTWNKVLDINYGGNVFSSKIGGECIVFGSDGYGGQNINILYTGGRVSDGNSLKSTIYRSTDIGQSWNNINSSVNYVIGNVSTIVENPVMPGIVWVGTDRGVWKGTMDARGYFTWQPYLWGIPPDYNYDYVKFRHSGDRPEPDANYNSPVHRIVITPDGNYIFVTMGEKIYRSISGGDFVELYHSPLPEPSGSWENILCAVTLFPNGSEYGLVASRIATNTRISYDYGNTWTEDIDCPVDPASWPKHVNPEWDDYISYSRNNFTYAQDYGWFSSGPFNCYKTQGTDFFGTWEFMVVDKDGYTSGINFPVVYDVTFGKGNNPYIYVPIADLVQARFEKSQIYLDQPRFHIKDYARMNIEGGCDYYMSNATRVLTSSANENLIFMVGGNLYGRDYVPWPHSIVRSWDNGDYFNIANNDLPLYEGNRAIIDALISDQNPDHMIVLVGGGGGDEYIDEQLTRGVFWTTTATWPTIDFVPCGGQPVFAKVGEGFTHQKNLENDPIDPSIKYLYLEQGYYENGGFYRSYNEGHDWEIGNNNFGVGYKDKGCLASAYDDYSGTLSLYLAMYGQGFFRSFNRGDSWQRVNYFTSAEQVAAYGSIVYVYGDPVSTVGHENLLFVSWDNGNNFSQVVSSNYNQNLPTVTHLTIDPLSPYTRAWISTTGMGVFLFDFNQGDIIPLSAKDKPVPFSYSLNQNYPNPFNPKTTIKYSIANDGNVKLAVYDIIGREIKKIENSYKTAGTYTVIFDGTDLASGIYLYRIESGNYVNAKKMVILK